MRCASQYRKWRLTRVVLTWFEKKFGWPLQDSFEHISMLIHPSHLQVPHRKYLAWSEAILNDWRSILEQDETNHERQTLLEQFKGTYSELRQTAGRWCPTFKETTNYFKYVLTDVQTKEVNSSNRQYGN